MSHRIREPAGLRGRIAGLVGGEWCSCWAQLCDSSPVCQRQPNERHMASSMVCSASTTHSYCSTLHIIKLTKWPTASKHTQALSCDGALQSDCSRFPATCQQHVLRVEKRWTTKCCQNWNFLFVSCCNCVERSDDHNSDIQKLNETLTLDSTPTAVVASGVLRWKRPWKNQFLWVCGCKEYVRAREWFLHVTIHKDLSEGFLR